MSQELWGQWIGNLQGTNNATVFLNIDFDKPNTGTISVYDFDTDNRASFNADIQLEPDNKAISATVTNFRPFFFKNPVEEAKKFVGLLPKIASLKGAIADNKDLEGKWSSDQNTDGTFKLYYQEPDKQVPADKVMAWEEFSKWALEAKKSNRDLVFRGQKDSTYRLTTLFHRQSRRELSRYVLEDVPVLQRHLTPLLNKKLSTEDAQEFGELLFLAQHHGFPTPLLDWSESPFVASYFAFQEVAKRPKIEGHARIFILDWLKWKTIGPGMVDTLVDPRPSFTPMYLQSRDNQRAFPQQALVTFSNVLRIENFIRYQEQRTGENVLMIIDIPYTDRDKAMHELQIMGVTSASLFPGIDGVCKALKEQYF